jgi:hypothetical protein
LTSGRLKTSWPAARSKSGNAINIAYKKPLNLPFSIALFTTSVFTKPKTAGSKSTQGALRVTLDARAEFCTPRGPTLGLLAELASGRSVSVAPYNI